jgi:cation:H+ antiporter
VVRFSPLTSLLVLAAGAVVLVVFGRRLAQTVDRLADRTGLGEAIAGAVLLGATTSLPGIITTAVAAADGNADFATANALGGIAVQTAFLPLADLTYRRANLEHAAASVPNLFTAIALVALLSLVLLASTGPDVDVLGVHPASVLIVLGYVYATRAAREAGDHPMWSAVRTAETKVDEPEEVSDESLTRLWLGFGALAVVVAASGWFIAQAGLSLAEGTGLSSTLVGAVFTGVITSLPELVTLMAAVRIGALTLGVANIIGGNLFDVLFIPVGDVFFREGSIYHRIGPETEFTVTLGVLLTSVVAAGLVLRQRKGIGMEGTVVLGMYVAGIVVLASGAI